MSQLLMCSRQIVMSELRTNCTCKQLNGRRKCAQRASRPADDQQRGPPVIIPERATRDLGSVPGPIGQNSPINRRYSDSGNP